MGRDGRWRLIYGVVRGFREPALASAVFSELDGAAGGFGRVYTDLGRMAAAGWLVEHEVVDAEGRERRAFTARLGGPPVRTPRGSLLSGLFRPAFA